MPVVGTLLTIFTTFLGVRTPVLPANQFTPTDQECAAAGSLKIAPHYWVAIDATGKRSTGLSACCVLVLYDCESGACGVHRIFNS